jgi:hypothetical protein
MDETKSLAPIKSEPKEVFAHLFAVGTLIASATSLFTLLSAIIDTYFGPVSQYIGADMYKSEMRFAISFLIVTFLLYGWVIRLISSWETKDVERKKIRIRKWMVYFTIFLAGIVLAGDAIAVLNSFLQGDFTSAFLLKALALAIIAGLVFTWYRAYGADQMPSWQRYILWSAVVVVVLSLLSGFVAVGSPMQQRDIKNDNIRISDLLQIKDAATTYWRAKSVLPESMKDLYSADNARFGEEPKDPVTGASYEYTKKDELNFEVCASFTRSAEKDVAVNTYYRPGLVAADGGSIYHHGAGRQCYQYSIDKDFLKPYPDTQVPVK